MLAVHFMSIRAGASPAYIKAAPPASFLHEVYSAPPPDQGSVERIYAAPFASWRERSRLSEQVSMSRNEASALFSKDVRRVSANCPSASVSDGG